MLLIAERVARTGELETDGRRDIAGIHLVQLHPLVGVHLKDTRDTLLLLLRGVVDVGTGIERTGVNSEVRQLPDERIRHDLERQRRERLLIGGIAVIRLAIRRRAFDRRDIQRARHILDHRVEHLLDALVAVCRAAGHRDGRTFAAALAEHLLQILLRRLFAVQVLHHQILIKVTELLHHLGVPLLALILHVVRDIRDLDLCTLLVLIEVRLHLHQVDNTLEGVFLADRELNADRVLAQTGLDLFDAAVEVSADDVHLVDESHTRNIVLIRLMPDILRLRLDTALGREDTDRAIQHTERTLDLNREVDMPRRIDDVDAVLQRARRGLGFFFQSPVARGGSGRDRDAALLLLDHPVHGSGTVMSLADLVVDAGVVKNPLGQCRLAGIDMSHDTDISGPLKRILSSRSSH